MLIGRNGTILLSDFGIAVASHQTHSVSLQNEAGTVLYMAPEQIQGKARLASDQYALGAVVYEWLGGSPPFTGASTVEIAMKHLSKNPPALYKKVPSLSPAVSQVIMKAIAKDPQQRFPQIQDFAFALEKAYQEEQRHVSVQASPSFLQNQPLLSTLRYGDPQMIEEESPASSQPPTIAIQTQHNRTRQVNTLSSRSVQEKPPLDRQVKIASINYRRRNILWFLAGIISTVILIALIGGLFLQTHADDLRYGSPRTFQIDAIVGHGGVSSEYQRAVIIFNCEFLNRRNYLKSEIAKSIASVAILYHLHSYRLDINVILWP